MKRWRADSRHAVGKVFKNASTASGSCLIVLTVTPAVRRRLQTVARNRDSPQKHAWRAKIVLQSADGVGINEIMRQTGTSKTCVWRWQERFMAEGFDGLLRDKARPSLAAPLVVDVAEQVVALTQTDPPALLAASSQRQIKCQSPSHGPPTLTKSPQPSNADIKC